MMVTGTVDLGYVSLDVVRGILCELDDVNKTLGELHDILAAHLRERGIKLRELSETARQAWAKLEEIDSGVLTLLVTIRHELEEAGIEVYPKGVELPTGRVIGEKADDGS